VFGGSAQFSKEFVEQQGKGRPSKLTPELAKTFLDTFKATNNVREAADRAAVTTSSVFDGWRKEGAKSAALILSFWRDSCARVGTSWRWRPRGITSLPWAES
jgi:hypothetical protein